MDKINGIVFELKKIAFYKKEVIKQFLNSHKLTITEIKELYVAYNGGGKCCLYGNKESMLHQFVDHVRAPGNWMGIMYGRGLINDTRWHMLNPDQKYQFSKAREEVFETFKGQKVSKDVRVDSVIEKMIQNKAYDINVEIFVKHALN